MGESYLTMSEIEAKYPDEWVLIDRPTTKRKTQEVTGGVVAAHSPDRTEFDHLWQQHPEIKEGAVLFTGKESAAEIEWVEPRAIAQ